MFRSRCCTERHPRFVDILGKTPFIGGFAFVLVGSNGRSAWL